MPLTRRSARRPAAAFVAVLLAGTLSVTGGSAGQARSGSFAPHLLERIAAAPAETIDALVSVEGRATAADAALLRSFGVHPLRIFDDFGVIYVAAPGASLLRLGTIPRVTWVTENARLESHGDTDMVATRAREAWDAKTTSTTPVLKGGVPVNGAGIGVAIVDSGIDGGHPDLAPAMAGNKKWVCSTPGLISTVSRTCFGNYILLGATGCTNDFWVDLTDTDTTSGHGTHVSGIVAGRGIASDGRFTGAAPGASLYGFGTGEGLSILFLMEAFNWIKCNHNTVSPAIRVVNNSWGISGGGGAYNASDPVNLAVNAMVAAGLVVVFSAGNNGGNGSSDVYSTYAKNPTPGVIGVANYDDAGTGTRTGSLDPSSSRGLSTASNKNNWPDVSAPGTFITSSAARTGAAVPPGLELEYEPYYTPATGTSMAAPHVCGIVAQLLQFNPGLSPAQIEDILEDHAVQLASAGAYVSDPTNPTTTVNFAAGHGLVDAIGSLHDSRVGATGGSNLPQLSQGPHVYVPNVDVQLVSGVQWTVPAGVQVQLSERFLETGNATTYPLAIGQAANFKIIPSSGPVVNASATIGFDGTGPAFRFSKLYTFAAPGTYRVEPQVNFGSVLVSFNSFVVRVI